MNTTFARTSLDDPVWPIVKAAGEDGPRSLNRDESPARLVNHPIRVWIARPLASQRLETVRRSSVRAWYCDRIRWTDMQARLDFSGSVGGARQILKHTAGHRGFARSVQDCPV